MAGTVDVEALYGDCQRAINRWRRIEDLAEKSASGDIPAKHREQHARACADVARAFDRLDLALTVGEPFPAQWLQVRKG